MNIMSYSPVHTSSSPKINVVGSDSVKYRPFFLKRHV